MEVEKLDIKELQTKFSLNIFSMCETRKGTRLKHVARMGDKWNLHYKNLKGTDHFEMVSGVWVKILKGVLIFCVEGTMDLAQDRKSSWLLSWEWCAEVSAIFFGDLMGSWVLIKLTRQHNCMEIISTCDIPLCVEFKIRGS